MRDLIDLLDESSEPAKLAKVIGDAVEGAA